MITKVKLHSNGYIKTYESGKAHSINTDYRLDEEVQEFLADGGVVEAEFTQTELDATIVEDNLVALKATDRDMAEVAEHLVDLLVSKGLITESELPQVAQDVLITRRNAKANL